MTGHDVFNPPVRQPVPAPVGTAGGHARGSRFGPLKVVGVLLLVVLLLILLDHLS
ncbi:hypothetical protein ACRAWF_05730 [Streptomyces sp. L7]